MAALAQAVVHVFGTTENGKIERDPTRGVNEMGCKFPAVTEDDTVSTVTEDDTASTVTEVDTVSSITEDHTTTYNQPNLGDLEIFPLEILHMIVSDLDLESLTNFRSASRGTKVVTESISKLTSLYALAPRVIQAVVSFGAGSWMTCDELRDALTAKNCDTCNKPASLIYTLTCKRVCPYCFTSRPKYPTSFAKFAQSVCSLTEDDMKKLRTITIPEKNACAHEMHPTFHMVNKQEVIEVALQHSNACLDHILRMLGDDEEYYTDTDNQADHDDDAASEAPSTISNRADLIGSIVFFGGAIRAPHVDFRTGVVEWGTCCKTCAATGREGLDKMSWTDAIGRKDARYFKECEGAMAILGCMDYCQHVARTASGGYVPPDDDE